MRKGFLKSLVLIAILATGIAVTAPAMTSIAEGYRYTIRVFAGNRGKLPSDPVVTEVEKGADIDLYEIATPEITDAKYVQTGFRLSGQDKLYGNGKVNGVTEDMDFVIAYGVEAETVPYTLKFVEYGTGRELSAPKTYYGKAGDKPVAAYEHIEGYRPRYLSITGTLRKGEENIWTFEYVPLGQGETIVTTTTTTGPTYEIVSGGMSQPTSGDENATGAGAGNGTANGASTNNATNDATAGNGNGTNEGGNDAVAGGSSGNARNESQEETAPQTQEILDLDTPLAGPSDGKAPFGPDATILGQPAIIASGCLGALLVAGIAFLLTRRRKAKSDEGA